MKPTYVSTRAVSNTSAAPAVAVAKCVDGVTHYDKFCQISSKYSKALLFYHKKNLLSKKY